jgi:hypothetical protein
MGDVRTRRGIWQYNPKEEDPVPFKADILHRGCVRYEPRRIITKLAKEVEKRKK